MRLAPVRDRSDAAAVLYEILAERPPESCISHRDMPTPEEHERFVKLHPFAWWYLITVDNEVVGSVEVTDRNEIGVSILKRCQRKGYGRRALLLFLKFHQPLPAIPALRNGNWLANIAVGNDDSKAFFAKLGFKPLQETWIHG